MGLLARIVKNYAWPDLMRQSPGRTGRWGDIQFTEEPVERCEYLVILNVPLETVHVHCPPENVWQILQEPPSPKCAHLYKGVPQARRALLPADESFGDPRMVATQTGLPWFVNQTYEELLQYQPPAKLRDVSWVTTKRARLPGHRKRLALLEKLRPIVHVDMFGRDFQYLEDKGDGLRPYRYSLAVENFSCRHYWTEKVADCLLSWTMPIYFGCTNLDEYFPPQSYIWLNIDDPHAPSRVREIVQSDQYEQSLDAIAEARKRILNEYQLFPLLARHVAQWRSQRKADARPEWIDIPAWRPSLRSRISTKLGPLKRIRQPMRRAAGILQWPGRQSSAHRRADQPPGVD